MTAMVDELTQAAGDTLTVEACDRELDHLRSELGDFPTRERRCAILGSVDRWLDARLAAAERGGKS